MTVSLLSLVRGRDVSYDTSYGEAVEDTKETDDGRAAAGRAMDRAQWEQQLERLHPASFAWALGCCGRDRHEAEEVLQETYVKIFGGKARFAGQSSLKTWLFAVIRRTAAARRRFRWLRTRPMGEVEEELPDGAPSAEQELLRSERAGRLLAALETLARRQREVLELCFYHDMTIAEAADVLGLTLGTARVHYQRGKERLRDSLQRMERQ